MRGIEIEDLSWQEARHWWFRARRRILGSVLAGVAWERPPRRVVDLGCGAAIDLEELAPPGAWRLGIERAAPALEAARARRAGAAGTSGASRGEREGLVLARGDAARLPLRDACADLLLALDVLEHLDDDTAALEEGRRVLRPGGRLLVTVPAWPSLWSEHDEALEHRRRYRRAGLLRRLRDAGLEIERDTYFNSLLFAPAALYRLLRRGLAPAGGSRGGGGAPASDTRRLGDRAGGLLFRLMAAERFWVGRGGRLPVGLSLLALARRP